MIELDVLIREAMKSGDKIRLETLRAIKTAEMEYRTAKNAKPLDDTAEVGILRKMISQREDAAAEYVKGGREDLAEKELLEVEVIKEFLPAEITQAEIEEAVEKWKKENNIENKIPKKSMGIVIKYVKSQLPMADGKLTADIVKNMLE